MGTANRPNDFSVSLSQAESPAILEQECDIMRKKAIGRSEICFPESTMRVKFLGNKLIVIKFNSSFLTLSLVLKWLFPVILGSTSRSRSFHLFEKQSFTQPRIE